LVGIGVSNPVIAGGLMLCIFSIAGVPPLAGFFSKIFLFFAALEGGLYRLAITGVLTSCVIAFYYIRLIKILYFEQPKT
jgi:NADH-quinone oxidoreductase subunit N